MAETIRQDYANEQTLNALLELTLSPYSWDTSSGLSFRFGCEPEIPEPLRCASIHIIVRQEITNRSGMVVSVLPTEGLIRQPDLPESAMPREITENEAELALSYFTNRINSLRQGKEWTPEEFNFRFDLAS